MGWTDQLKGVVDPLNILRQNDVKGAPGVPGVGGPAQGAIGVDANGNEFNRSLTPNPDGTFTDPSTGTRYSDAIGNTPIAAQNTAQQIAGATTNANDFLNRNAVQDQRGTAAYNGQKAFEGDLTQVIRNPNAPTVSTSVMNQALGNIDRQQLAGVAGVGGANAAASRKQALVNMGNLDTQAAGAGAVARATEVAGARQQLGNVLQQEAGNAVDSTGQNNQAAGAFSNLGMQGATANQNAQNGITQANMENENNNRKGAFGFIQGVGGAVGKVL